MRSLIKILIISLIFTSCTFPRVRHEADVLQEYTIIEGSLKINSAEDNAIYAALIIHENHILDYLYIANNQGYTFFNKTGTFKTYAFHDPNKNFKLETGEKLFAADPVKTHQLNSYFSDINITQLVEPNSKEYLSVQSLINNGKINKPKKRYTKNGTTISLNNRIFSRKYAHMGLWESLKFVKKIHPIIFMEEEYNPNKIPVLFVHGVSGTPADWKAIDQQVDKSKVQTWFYYYPSGFRLEHSAKRLNKLLWDLKDRYEFKKIIVVAHSMGGLVGRTFLVNNFQYPNKDFILFYVTLSTPWNGSSAANLGVEYSPTIVPSWHDVVPDSPFLKANFSKDMPEGVAHFLLFSYKGGKDIFTRQNNDGTVDIKSMLDERIQDKASLRYGFNEDHVGILNNKDVFDKISEIIIKYYTEKEHEN